MQKLSWFYYLQNNQQKADEFRALILKKGSTETEADKQAQKEALSGIWPDKLLLKARLLNDGGYNTEALKLLQTKSSAILQNLRIDLNMHTGLEEFMMTQEKKMKLLQRI